MQVGQYKARAYTSPTRLNFWSRTVRQVERQRYSLSTTWLHRFFQSPYIENIYHKTNHTPSPPPAIDTANWTQDSKVLTGYNPQRLHRISIFCYLSLPETPMWISCKRNGNIIVIRDFMLSSKAYIIKPPALVQNSYQIAITDTDTGRINYYCHAPTWRDLQCRSRLYTTWMSCVR